MFSGSIEKDQRNEKKNTAVARLEEGIWTTTKHVWKYE